MNTPAMIIDFEATDVSKEAEATQLGWRHVKFVDGIISTDSYYHYGHTGISSPSINCKPDRAISYGAMAVSHITNEDIAGFDSHKEVVQYNLPKGEAYIIGHNIDYDIQVAANAGVDVSQYKRICTQALARAMLPGLDSHSLGALTYAINPDLARQYCRNAHNAGWDVTFTLWLLEHLCELAGITDMEQLYLASEEARIPTAFTFGKYYGQKIADVDKIDRGYLQYVIREMSDSRPHFVQACLNQITSNININV